MAEGPFPLPSCRIREAAKARKAVEQELAHAVNSSSLALSEVSSCKSNGGAPEVGRGLSHVGLSRAYWRAGGVPWASVLGGACGLFGLAALL